MVSSSSMDFFVCVKVEYVTEFVRGYCPRCFHDCCSGYYVSLADVERLHGGHEKKKDEILNFLFIQV